MENYVKINLKGVIWDGMDWINVAEDRDKWLALSECSNET
jgi:hypothetical protein